MGSSECRAEPADHIDFHVMFSYDGSEEAVKKSDRPAILGANAPWIEHKNSYDWAG